MTTTTTPAPTSYQTLTLAPITSTTVASTITTLTSIPTITFTATSSPGTDLTVTSGQTVTVPSGMTEIRPVVQGGGELVLSSGASAVSVTLSPTATLALDPGASASSTGFTNATLELASGTGGSAGILNAGNLGLSGSTGTLRVDSGSSWTVSGDAGSTNTTGVTTVYTSVSGTTVPVTTRTITTGTAAITLSNSGTLAISGTAILAAVTGPTAGAMLGIGASGDVDVLGAVGSGQVIGFGAGSTLELASPGSFSGTLNHFVLGDTLVIDNFTGTTGAYTEGVIAVIGTTNGTREVYQFELAGTPTNEQVTFSTSGGRTVITDNVACFCADTLILTDRGEVPVDRLRIGDTVVTAAGVHRPIVWIGRRSYAGRFLSANPGSQPVRFRAGCLGDGLPRRDLLISPNHALLLGGLLIPAGCLVNGTTVARETGLDQVDYFHVELDSHDVLLAEGTPSESFVDDNSRGMFHNVAEWQALNPGQVARPAVYCYPRMEAGYALEQLRRRLAEIAAARTQAA